MASFSVGSFSAQAFTGTGFDGLTAVSPSTGGAWGQSWGQSWGSAWGIAKKSQDGRSGYWRLFYHQLQAESLKRGDKKKQATVKLPAIPKPQKRIASAQPKYAEPTFARLPPLPPPVVIEAKPDMRMPAWRISVDIQQMLIPYIYGRAYAKISTNLGSYHQAANDDNEDEELLLLLA